MTATATPDERLRPYLPRLLLHWLGTAPDERWRELEGTLVFVDVSGFTAMSERLARRGKVGAEEVTDVVGAVFTRLLAVAYGNGGGLVKFGGDALLLFFAGPGHAARGARSAAGMRQALREIGRIPTSAGGVTLRMSAGVHTGTFLFALVGESHRELVLTGPAVTEAVTMEQVASAGEIVVSRAVAAVLPAASLGAERGSGRLLRRSPPGLDPAPDEEPVPAGLELLSAVPAGLREHLLSGVDDPEHRPVTVAFLRFAGVDALVAGAGTDAAVGALDQLVVSVQRAADANGVTFLGTDVDRDGGKLILVAGAPRALGGDEERMLHALRSILAAPQALSLSAGVNRGHVFAGDVGPPYRRTYTVMGDAVNLAARLMARAPAGSVLAATQVLEASATAFAVERVDPFTVKGKAEPVSAVLVGQPLRARAGAAAELPLVGRGEELDAIEAAIADARAERGGLVEIVGPPGIGKSRLLGELAARAGGMRLVRAACDPYSAATPYRPVQDLLRAALGVPPEASRLVLARRLRERVRSLAPELTPWLPLLGIPLDLDLPATPEVADLADEFRRARLEAATGELLERLLPGPAVVAIEDVHWLDEASASLLTHLAGGLERRAWLLCVTRRPEQAGFAPPAEGARVTTLRPSPLPASEARALAIAASEDAPLRPDQVRALVHRAGGNPLFVQELVRGVRRAGGLEGLPDSLEALTMAEIDRLAPGDRRVLRRASVLGLAFDDELLGTLFEPHELPGPDTWLRLAEFVVEEEPGRRRFRHALVRDAAYEGLAFSRRQELHALVAEAIEAAAADPEDEAELLSLHYLHAGRAERAWSYARLAGERALAKYASSEAAALFRRALAASRHPGADVPSGEIAALLDALGEVAERIGAYDEAERSYREAGRRLAAEPVALARVLSKQAIVAEKTGRYVPALRLLGRGLRLLEGMDDAGSASVRAELATRYAGGRFRQGRHREAARWCVVAIAEAERAGDRAGLAWAYLMLDAVNTERGGGDEPPYGRLALPMLEELGELQGLARQLVNLGARAFYEGDWPEAAALYDRGLELFRRIGDAAGEAQTGFNLGELLVRQGRLDTAEAYLADAARFWRAAGDRIGVALAVSELALVAARRGGAQRALELLAEARAEFARAGAEADLLETDARICEVLVAAGEGERALALVEDLLARMRSSGEIADVREHRLLRLRGEALALLGRAVAAREALEASLAGARGAKALLEEAHALGALARAAGGPAEVLDAQRREILERLGAA